MASPTDHKSGAGTPVFEHYGMGEYSNKRFFLSKCLSFCPAPKEIDTLVFPLENTFPILLDIYVYVDRSISLMMRMLVGERTTVKSLLGI